MSDDTFRHQVYPDLIHAANDAGYVMHATGAAALGAMIIAMSVAFIWVRSGRRGPAGWASGWGFVRGIPAARAV